MENNDVSAAWTLVGTAKLEGPGMFAAAQSDGLPEQEKPPATAEQQHPRDSLFSFAVPGDVQELFCQSFHRFI